MNTPNMESNVVRIKHTNVTIDGAPATLEQAKVAYPDAIIRIGRHLYMNGIALTVDAPAWESNFPAEAAAG